MKKQPTQDPISMDHDSFDTLASCLLTVIHYATEAMDLLKAVKARRNPSVQKLAKKKGK